MSGTPATCPDCGKPTVPTGEWDRLSEREKEQVCRCVVKIGGFSQTVQVSPADPKSASGKSTLVGEPLRAGLGGPMITRRPWPDLLGLVMGAIGVVIFCLGLFGCAFAITYFVISSKGSLSQISLNPREELFIQIAQSLLLVVGGSLMYLLARISHLLWREQVDGGK